MTTRERILAIKLLEKQERNPEYANRIGIQVSMVKKDPKTTEGKMFELLVIVLFCWIFFGSIRLMFKVAWGLAKILAVILFILALPSLIGCLLYARGVILLLPVALIAIAWGILKACI